MVDIPEDFAQCAVQLKHSSVVRPAFITFGVSNVADNSVTALCNAVQTATQTSIKGRFDSAVTIGPTTARLGVSSGEPLAGISTAATGVGAQTMQGFPPNVALLVSKLTGRGGRRGRGRMFMPWVLSSTEAGETGIVLQATLDAWLTSLTAWLAALSTAGEPMVLLHNPGQSAPGPPDTVGALIPQSLVGSQRRRLGR